METFAYLAAAFIGLSLGLIGGGGSIMTVPVLVYLFGLSPVLATSYSLFIVGSTSMVGAFNNYRKGYVNIKTALLFGISSISTVFLTRKFIIPAIPAHIATIGRFQISQDMLTMVLFAVLMLLAATAMIRSGSESYNSQPLNTSQMPDISQASTCIQQINSIRKSTSIMDIPERAENTDSACILNTEERPIDLPRLLFYGTGIGLATGILGAGGGFLLIPTLVLLVGLPMKEAIGTSLLIIALNSLIGFTGDLGHFTMNWFFLIKITSIAIMGIFAGGYLNRKMPADRLKKGFGIFVLVMGIYIILRELVFKPL